MPTFELESELIDGGYKYIAGVDEVGRGPLCGPVTAAAVVVDLELVDVYVKYAKDSKKLSDKKRQVLSDLIRVSCNYSIVSVDNTVIDKINILNATKLAMKEAVTSLDSCDYVLVDGNMNFGNDFPAPYRSIVKGDDISVSIACASIIAKVFRDKFMLDLSKRYPQYGLEKHKGYGTKQHREALEKYGPCPYHRLSFGGVS